MPRAEANNRSVDFFANEIRTSWQKAAESVIETGRVLLEAKRQLPHGEFGDMVRSKLPFGERTAQMLMTIAKHPLLSKPKHASVLPACWTTLYELAKLPEAALKRMVADGELTPGIERADVKRYLERQSTERGPRTPPIQSWLRAISRLPEMPDLTGHDLLLLDDAQWRKVMDDARRLLDLDQERERAKQATSAELQQIEERLAA
jgi:hypothetical protein